MKTTLGGALSVKNLRTSLKQGYSKDKVKQNIGDYEYNEKLSNKEAQVYYNPITNHSIVAHRGSQGFNDYLTDAAYIMTGYKGDRFKNSSKVQKQAEDLYGSQNVSTVGHSLGSWLSSDVGKNSKEIINLNKPYSPFARKRDNEINIRTKSDPFSFSLPTEDDKNKTINKSYWNPSYNHSVDRLEKMNENEIVGTGLLKKDLKLIIKNHNKNSNIKIRYGTLSKKELKDIVKSIQ